MKTLITVLLVSLSVAMSFGQILDSVRLSDLEHQKNYFTKNSFSVDRDGLHLFYKLNYNDTTSWDEEFSHTIYLHVPDKVLTSYSVDSLVKYYSKENAIGSKRETQDLSGQVHILGVSQDTVKVTLEIQVLLDEQSLTCTGEKLFTKEL